MNRKKNEIQKERDLWASTTTHVFDTVGVGSTWAILFSLQIFKDKNGWRHSRAERWRWSLVAQRVVHHQYSRGTLDWRLELPQFSRNLLSHNLCLGILHVVRFALLLTLCFSFPFFFFRRL